MTPTPMLPAPMTPIALNSMLCRLPGELAAPALPPEQGRGDAGRRFGTRRAEAGCEKPHRRALEETHYGESLVQLPLDRGDYQYRPEGAAARVEEVVVDAEPRPAEDLPPDVRERRF